MSILPPKYLSRLHALLKLSIDPARELSPGALRFGGRLLFQAATDKREEQGTKAKMIRRARLL